MLHKNLLFLLVLPLFLKADWIESSGDILQLALPVGAALYSYEIDDTQGLKSLGWAYTSTITATYMLKYSVQKPRPNGANKLSFPSGHTASAFSGASYLQMRYGWKIGVPAYLTAAFVGYSRVYSNNHDIYDVTAGAALATLCSYYFVERFKGLKVVIDTQSIQIAYRKRF